MCSLEKSKLVFPSYKYMQTVSIIRGFFLAMALYPEVLKKAQEEIDSVVGSQRLPTISDRSHLPYINSLIMELFRWMVAVPNG
jgi:cytochrome P450